MFYDQITVLEHERRFLLVRQDCHLLLSGFPEIASPAFATVMSLYASSRRIRLTASKTWLGARHHVKEAQLMRHGEPQFSRPHTVDPALTTTCGENPQFAGFSRTAAFASC